MGRCFLCQPSQPVPDEDLWEHLATEHPEAYREPERWPDGELVVVDETLEPDDFEQ